MEASCNAQGSKSSLHRNAATGMTKHVGGWPVKQTKSAIFPQNPLSDNFDRLQAIVWTALSPLPSPSVRACSSRISILSIHPSDT